MEVSIVIPCYNEEKRLPPTIKKIKSFLAKNNYVAEIIVVDDGSTDNTSRAAAQAQVRCIRLQKNQGKGAAVRCGILEAGKKWILVTDADLSTPINELEKFIPHSKNHDIIIGSRNLPQSKIELRQPPMRSLLGKGFSFIVPLLLQLQVKDSQCGFKFLRAQCAKKIARKMRISGWAFDAELLFLAKKYHLKIKEIPVRWRNSAQSKVNSLQAPLQMLGDLARIRYNDMQGNYGK